MIELNKMNMNRHLQSRHRQKGLGIVEVLVALVVVSVGVLGMASLQLTGMKHSSGGFNRSKALLFAQSMATRMRINEDAARAQAYEGFDSSTDANCNVPPVPYCQARKGAAAASCTSEQMATFDMFSVVCGDVGTSGADKGVIGTLPNGTLTISCLNEDGDVVTADCDASSAYEVNVSWSEGRARTDSDQLIEKRVQMRLKP